MGGPNGIQADKLADLARSYAGGDSASGKALVESVNEEMIPQLSHEIRAALMDAIMSGKKIALDDRSQSLLRASLYATNDEGYLAARGQHYLVAGEQMAAETLLEWRVVLAARKQQASDAHIDALMDLSDAYLAGGKATEARELRDTAAKVCEKRVTQATDAARLLNRIAQSCFDATDYAQAESVLTRTLSLLEKPSSDSTRSRSVELIDSLRLLHAFKQKRQKYDEAQTVARRIQNLQGLKDGIDEIDRLLTTYANLPDYFELSVRPDGVDLFTDDFPKIVEECSGLDLKKYFLDAFAQYEGLSSEQREKIAADLFGVMRTVTKFVTAAAGATLTRSEETSIELPAAMSQGYVQKVNFGTTVTFRLVPNPPDEATFVDVTGITFSVGGKLLTMSELSLRADGDKCIVTPLLGECGQVKQNASNVMEAIKNTGKDFLVSLFLKTKKKFSFAIPIVLDEYRCYLSDAINLKRSLQYKEKDLLSFFERSSRIQVDDPLTRAILEGGLRVRRKVEDMQIERQSASACDLGGVVLKFASNLELKMSKKKNELEIPSLYGVDVKVAFDAPSELKVIGLDLRRALPARIESLTLSPAKNKLRRIVVGTAPERWLALDLNENMRPAFDRDGNWIVFGVTSNPISGAPQKFFLRLDSNNELNMNTREIADLISQTAVEGFDPNDPLTWQWGAVAIGAQTLLTAGAVLRSTIGDDEIVDKIEEEVQDVVKLIKDFFF